MLKFAPIKLIFLCLSLSSKGIALEGIGSLYGKEMKPASLILDIAPQVKIPVKLNLKSSRIDLNVSRIFLGDLYGCEALASVCAEISGVDLGESPTPGKIDTIRAEDLHEQVLDRIGDEFEIEFGEADIVSLRSRVQSFSESMLLDSLEQKFRKLGESDGYRINIKNIRPKKALKIRPGKISLAFLNFPEKVSDFFSLKTRRAKKRMVVAAEILTDFDGFSEAYQADLIVTYEMLANVFIANQLIPAGKIARRDYFSKDWVPVNKMPIFDFKNVDGKKLTRRLREGEYLTVGLYKEPSVINRGEEVDVIMVNNGMQLKRKAKALNHAGLGEEVNIRLKDNRKLKGVAISKSTVRISL